MIGSAMVKTTPYESQIRGDYLVVYRTYFPFAEMMSPPQGWAFLRLSQWRKGCPDECWRIKYIRQPPTS